ncbi:Immunoglobulin heavy constant epsilon [Manis javanica]|nr:Immunoglobulin heavy constant epsilon [Manis javanica]
MNASSLTLGCLVADYFPEPVTVTWDSGSLKRSTVAFPSAHNPASSLYTTVSQMTASGEWAKQTFTCSVAHAASTTNKTISVCAADFSPPTVKLFHSSCQPNGDDRTVIQLLCLISGYHPDEMEVSWLVDGHREADSSQHVGPVRQEGKANSTHSEFNITQADWVSQKTYTCQVSYRGLTFQDHARKCTESDPRGVSTYLIPPSPLDLYVHKSPKITCLVVDLASVDDMTLKWTRESKLPLPQDQRVSKRHFNGTYTFMSTLPVDATDWIEGETYYCTVNHPDLPIAIVRSISKAPGKRAAPEVHVFPPPEEGQGPTDKLTLTCLAQNFFPADISVLWLRNDVAVRTDQYTTTWPRRTSGSVPTFFVFSRLEVSRTDWTLNSKFSCQVVHEALTQTRTLEKTVSKAPGK